MTRTETVVIGGGVMGLFAAWFLAEQGVRDIVLLEKRTVGAGSSGKSGAILRQHYSHETTVRMARESLIFYRSFEACFGHDIGFRQTGMLFTCHAGDRASLEANVALQKRLGVDVEILDAAELRRLDPRAKYDDDIVGAHERDAGFVDPGRTLAALKSILAERGVEVREHTRVADITVDGGRVTGVRTEAGATFACERVVNAGGPWAARLCARLGLDLPLKAIRPEQAFFLPPGGAEQIVGGDMPTGLYWKPEPGGWTRVGKLAYDGDQEISDPDVYDEGVSGAFIDLCRGKLAERKPEYRDAVSWGGCAALYTVTPDAHALIGPVPGIDGLSLVAGFSGHGFKLGPAVGRGLAAQLTGSDPGAFDPDFFAVDRFDRGQAIGSAYEYGILG